MSPIEELELASRRARERQGRFEHAFRQFCADCKWALADSLGVVEATVHFLGEGPNGVETFHWEGDEVRTQLVLTVAGTEFRFPVRFRPDLAEAHHAVSVADSEYTDYARHGGIWRIAGGVRESIRHYFDTCRHVEPLVAVRRLTLPAELLTDEDMSGGS